MTEAFQSRGAAVVSVGAFAPAMFHPLWFERYGLLGKQEADAAADPKTLLVSEDLTLFKVAGFEFDIRPDKLQIGTRQENLFAPLRDLVTSTLQILDAAPTTAFGVNWGFHFPLPSEAAWHRAGHKMIPHSFWSRLWKKHIGMKNVTVELAREDEYKGSVQVTLQPSSIIKTGVFVSVNDHYEVDGIEGRSLSSNASEVMLKQWTNSESIASKIAERVREECTNA